MSPEIKIQWIQIRRTSRPCQYIYFNIFKNIYICLISENIQFVLMNNSAKHSNWHSTTNANPQGQYRSTIRQSESNRSRENWKVCIRVLPARREDSRRVPSEQNTSAGTAVVVRAWCDRVQKKKKMKRKKPKMKTKEPEKRRTREEREREEKRR